MCRPLGSLFIGPARRIPLVRGVIALVETLALGMRALTYSANVAAEAEGEEIGKGAIAGMLVVSLTLAIGLFFLVPVFASSPLEGLLGSDITSNVAEGLIRLGLFLGYILLIGQMKDIRRVFMYHGAEHMTVHVQERAEPLTVENVRKYSTAHPRCGTAFLLVVVVVAIFVFVALGHPPLWLRILSRIALLPVIAGLAYEIIRFHGAHSNNRFLNFILSPSLALQMLTTRKPDEKQIEVAITAVKGALEADEAAEIEDPQQQSVEEASASTRS
jgi:uncharacterized protein YqhQ